MTPTKSLEEYMKELATLAEGLPFKKVEIDDFKKAKFEPEKIRQPRTFHSPDSKMQSIGRFLIERGTVEILTQEFTIALFTEIHWGAYNIRKLAQKKYKTTKHAHESLIEARRLVSRIEGAEEELFIANRRLVVSCIKPFFWIGQVWLADFLQEGSKALSNAVRKFDFTRGTPFYSYAQKAIQNRLRNYFRDHVRSGSLGIRPTSEMVTIKGILDKWNEDHEEPPPTSVLSDLTGIEEERIKKILPFIKQWEKMPTPPVSLDALLGETNANLHDFVEDKDAVGASDAAEKSEIWAAIDKLPPRSKHILEMRFIEGRTLEETGQMLDLTRARIKQIQDDALRKLRQILRRGINHPNM